MGFLRKRGGKYSLSFKWKGKQEIKALGTGSLSEAEKIKTDAEAQLERIRKGQSATASRLLKEGFCIVDVLFGSERVAARLSTTTEDNPITLAEISEGFLSSLKNTVSFDQQANSESWMKKVRAHVGDDRRVMSLTDDDLATYAKRRTELDGVGNTSILKEFGCLRSAIKWAIRNKKLSQDPISKWPCLKSKRQKRFEWKADIEAIIKTHAFEVEKEKQAFLREMKARMVLTAEDMKQLIDLAVTSMPQLALPLKVACSSGIRRKELATLRKQDFDAKRGTIIVGSRKQSKSVEVTYRTISLPSGVVEALREHVYTLRQAEIYLFPIFGEIDMTYGHRWVEYEKDAKGNPRISPDGYKIVKTDRHGKPILSKRKLPEDRLRAEKAGRMLDSMVRYTAFEMMNGWHCLRHSFISICVSKGLTWQQIAEWVGHVSPDTTRLYTHFDLKDSKMRMESLNLQF